MRLQSDMAMRVGGNAKLSVLGAQIRGLRREAFKQ